MLPLRRIRNLLCPSFEVSEISLFGDFSINAFRDETRAAIGVSSRGLPLPLHFLRFEAPYTRIRSLLYAPYTRIISLVVVGALTKSRHLISDGSRSRNNACYADIESLR